MTTLCGPVVILPPEKLITPVKARKASRQIYWTPSIAISVIHLGALLAFVPAFFSWKALLTTLVLQLICGLSITLGYHRLLTHRSFKTPKPVEYFLSWLGSLSWQGGPIQWVATHRLHHQHSDQEPDPHSPHDGFFWSHMLWTFTYDPQFDDYDKYSKYAMDLARDPVHQFIERTTPLWQFVLAGALFLWGYVGGGGVWGGLSCVVWGSFVRLVYVYHTTWLVNSATHTWGYRNFQTGDDSRNLWWVALLAFGEGWHNNHHAYPRSARHGLKFWEFDLTWLIVRCMSLVRLASDIRLPERGASRECH